MVPKTSPTSPKGQARTCCPAKRRHSNFISRLRNPDGPDFLANEQRVEAIWPVTATSRWSLELPNVTTPGSGLTADNAPFGCCDVGWIGQMNVPMALWGRGRARDLTWGSTPRRCSCCCLPRYTPVSCGANLQALTESCATRSCSNVGYAGCVVLGHTALIPLTLRRRRSTPWPGDPASKTTGKESGPVLEGQCT